MTSVTIGTNVGGIANSAFSGCTSLTNVIIGNSVTSIGDSSFLSCTSLTSVTIPNSVTSIGDASFSSCISLTSVTIPNSVTNIGYRAFGYCSGLARVTIANSVTNIGWDAFDGCSNLIAVSFEGNAPAIYRYPFSGDTATVYYLPGTTGWGTTFGYLPAMLWNPQVLTSDSTFGVRTNQFGFTITGTSNLVIVVEASTNLASQTWSPMNTNTLTSGSSYFRDPQWTNYPARFYRLMPGGLPNVSPAPWGMSPH